jgi:hypothetical protein
MKKLVIVLFFNILTAGSAFAQWVYYYYPPPQTVQTITGTLQIINGSLAIVNSGNQVFYVPNLQPYYGINGLYANTAVTVHGIVNNSYFEPLSFMLYGTWYSLPAYYYYYYAPPQPTQTIYVPLQQPTVYPGRFGWWGW